MGPTALGLKRFPTLIRENFHSAGLVRLERHCQVVPMGNLRLILLVLREVPAVLHLRHQRLLGPEVVLRLRLRGLAGPVSHLLLQER